MASTEVAQVRAACLLTDRPYCNVALADLEQHAALLYAGEALPVGTVEFVRRAMRIAGINEPQNLSYPPGCEPWLRRELGLRKAGEVLGRWFVKPQKTKAFTGFVFDSLGDPSCLTPHDAEQHAAFMALDPSETVYAGEVVQFLSEWRFYVADGQVHGRARYDDGDDHAPEPDGSEVAACIRAMGLPHPYALDMGVLSTGETAIVEVNDFWAIGLYDRALNPRVYLDLLQRRWNALV
jgi:hypothetical protein